MEFFWLYQLINGVNLRFQKLFHTWSWILETCSNIHSYYNNIMGYVKDIPGISLVEIGLDTDVYKVEQVFVNQI